MANRYLERKEQIIEQHYDEDGVFLGSTNKETVTSKYIPVNEEPYHKTYERAVDIVDFAHGHLFYFINALATKMTYSNDGQIVVLQKNEKEQLSKRFGVSVPRINQLIKESVELGYMCRVGWGKYSLSPFIVAKGNYRDVMVMQQQYILALRANGIYIDARKNINSNKLELEGEANE